MVVRARGTPTPRRACRPSTPHRSAARRGTLTRRFAPRPASNPGQVVKEIWKYIKANDLQDPKNRRNIVLDDKLATIFTAPVTMFSMNKQLSRHVKAADAVTNGSDDEGGGGGGGGGSAAKKPRARSGGAKKRAAGGGGGSAAKKPRGMYGEVTLSDELAAVTGRHRMARSDLTKWFWAYVKQHELQVGSGVPAGLPDGSGSGVPGVWGRVWSGFGTPGAGACFGRGFGCLGLLPGAACEPRRNTQHATHPAPPAPGPR